MATGLQKAVDRAPEFQKNFKALRGGGKKAAPIVPISERGGRFTPEPMSIEPLENESLNVWGFKDTRFFINQKGNVELSGNRYALSGQELPRLLPWIQRILGNNVDAADTAISKYPTHIPEAVVNAPFMESIEKIFQSEEIVNDGKIRLRHGHGHTQEEMYAVKYGRMERIPDLVIFPTSEEQITSLVAAAVEHDVVIIPFGGGTNVTDALRCSENEARMIVSVDMRRMNRILWIDPVNRMASVEAGAVGRNLIAALARHGFTMGHEPDSLEFSTLGGWIATHASGMKKNRYGNIESLILDMRVVTSNGILSRSMAAPRESIGIDPKLWLLGSEGSLGIITSAVVKLFPIPEEKKYGSVIFPSFEEGVQFMYELSRQSVRPASVRLVDNLQFQLSQALKPASAEDTVWKENKGKLQKLFVTAVKGFDPDKMTACTLVFEGTEDEVAYQEKLVYGIARDYGGLKGGSENGERGYQLTFGIAYIRDFMMNHHLMAESFETSVPWTNVTLLCENVKRRIFREHAARNLPGRPFVTCRVTQIYDTGACIYFYFAFYAKGIENPDKIFNEIEHAAREEILASGGSLSHHHGIGKLRKDFIPEIMSDTMIEWKLRQKAALDPANIFATGNQIPEGRTLEAEIPVARKKMAPAISSTRKEATGFRKWFGFLFFFKRKRKIGPLKDRTIVITGASSGIGEAAALEAARRGARPVLIARRESELSRVRDHIEKQTGVVSSIIAADITREKDRQRIESVLSRENINILINNAGITAHGRFDRTKPDVMRRTMEINFFALAELTHLLLPIMKRSSGIKTIVHVSSPSGLHGLPGRYAYSASKAASNVLMESLRVELHTEDFNVLNYMPGYTRTALRTSGLDEKGGRLHEEQANHAKDPEDVANIMLDAIEKGKHTAFSDFTGRFVFWARVMIPGMFSKILHRRFQKAPEAHS